VFQHPESRFVAGFLGYASFLPGLVEGHVVHTGVGPVPRDQIHGLDRAYEQTTLDVLVRPDDLTAEPVGLEASDAAAARGGPSTAGRRAEVDGGRPGSSGDDGGGPDGAGGDGTTGAEGTPGDGDTAGTGRRAVGNGVVTRRRYLGPTVLYEVDLDDGTTVQCMHNHDELFEADERVEVTLAADHELAWFPGEQRPDPEATHLKPGYKND
jgi:iron(III) transport system ATP-binding protein